MRLRIEVRERDIKDGVVGDCERCPVAQALSRMGYSEFLVDTDRIEWLRGDYSSSRIPKRVGKMIIAFDQGKPMLPFSFYLEKPGGRS